VHHSFAADGRKVHESTGVGLRSLVGHFLVKIEIADDTVAVVKGFEHLTARVVHDLDCFLSSLPRLFYSF